MNNLDIYYLRIAFETAAKHSQDTYTQVGSVLVSENREYHGANTFVIPATHDVVKKARNDRDYKLSIIQHSERNAIYSAWNHNDTKGSTLYCTWACCTDCAKTIIAAGISRVVTSKYMIDHTPERWRDKILMAHEMLRSNGITVDIIEHPEDFPPIRYDGKLIEKYSFT